MTEDRWFPIAKNAYDPLKAGSIDGTDDIPHDKAIQRAMSAKYKPNKAITGDAEKTVFVARLNLNTTEETIEKTFSRYGEIKRLKLVRDIVTGFSKGYAFVEYCSQKSAERAERKADKLIVDGSELFVDLECERKLKGWIPRRLGGGFGGRKESGQLRFGGKDRPFRQPLIVGRGSDNTSQDRPYDRYGDRNHDRYRDNYSDRRHDRSRDRYGYGDRDEYREKSRSHYDKDRTRNPLRSERREEYSKNR